MDEVQSNLLLRRSVLLKVVVTPRWKEEVERQLKTQMSQHDSQLQQIEMQGQRAIAELQKQQSPQATQQIDSINSQVNQKRTELQERKNQFLQQLEQVQQLSMEQEVAQGQIDSFFRVSVGDNLVKKMNVEILVRDGVVEEIRGEL
ncbi:MAG: YlqD family protein [Spirulinaceae cyanobacterium]